METTLRTPVHITLDINLINRVKTSAREFNMSLSRYIESVLFDNEYYEPNEETKVAIEEAMNMTEEEKRERVVDCTSVESMLKSMGL